MKAADGPCGTLIILAKYALIVDDSRTARHALGAILAANGLRVETAASAEQALEHLGHSRPDVIFMDHQMPGMDGLQAVRVIKANPATATIPIMMYTSQGGELYVGQARALGALGVLPKDIKPVEVSELLQSLRLVEGAGDSAAPTAAEAPAPGSVPPAAATPAMRDELELWVQSLLALQARELRDEVQEAVARALREHGPGVATMVAGPPPPARRRTPVLLFLVLALTAIAGMLLMLNLELQREWRRAVGEGAELAAALDLQRATGPAGTAPAPVAEAMRTGRDAEFLAALEWGINQAATYPAGQEPFGDRSLEMLRGLVERLGALGFAGIVHLEGHVGDFCEVEVVDGLFGLAPDELPVERCTRIGLPPGEAQAASARQSIAFANYLASRAADPRLRVEVLGLGASRPAVPYPGVAFGLTAGEWNAVAGENNRIRISLEVEHPP